MYDCWKSRIIKSIAAICFVLISVSLIVARNSPAIGYESSIYTSTPIIVWIFLLISLCCGIIIIVYQLYIDEHKTIILIIGLLLIALVYTGILGLWIIRDYRLLVPGDPIFHLIKTEDVVSTGHFGIDNFYPITHIFLSEISIINNISPVFLYKSIPLIFSILYIIFMYLFAKSILPEKEQIIFATLSSTAMIHGWYLNLTPNHLANLIFPLALFLLIKSFNSNAYNWKILFLFMVLLFPIFHPIVGFALLVVLWSLWVPDMIIKPNKNIEKNKFKFITPESLILIIWGFYWLSSFLIFKTIVHNTYLIASEGGPSQLDSLKAQIDYADNYGYSVIEQIIKVYGGTILYMLCAIIGFPILLKRLKVKSDLKNMLSLFGPLSIFIFFIIILYLFNLLFSPLRLVMYLVIISTIFVGYIFYEIIKNVQNSYFSKLVASFIIVIMIGISINGILLVYPSTYILSPNTQIPQTEIEGSRWFFLNKNTALGISSWYYPSGLYANLLLTSEEKANRNDITSYMMSPFPNHFGYNENSTLGQSYGKDIYLVITEKIKKIYIDVFPRMAEKRLLPNDFIKLENDLNVNKLYSNGGFEIWYVKSVEKVEL